MGFSTNAPGNSEASMDHGGGITGDEQTHVKGPSLGSQVLNRLTAGVPGASVVMPQAAPPAHDDAVGNDMIAANAKPPEGGGMSSILKLLMGV